MRVSRIADGNEKSIASVTNLQFIFNFHNGTMNGLAPTMTHNVLIIIFSIVTCFTILIIPNQTPITLTEYTAKEKKNVETVSY